jgi:glutathione S-transferase
MPTFRKRTTSPPFATGLPFEGFAAEFEGRTIAQARPRVQCYEGDVRLASRRAPPTPGIVTTVPGHSSSARHIGSDGLAFGRRIEFLDRRAGRKRTMLELYHNNMSSCAQKVRVALAEKGLDWKGHHLNLRAGDQQRPEYLRLNPKGVVPTLIDGDKVIRESNVILEYLDDAFPSPPLLPSDPYGRARVRLWNQRLAEGHHDIATATLSMGIAFRHQYLVKGEPACRELIDKVPDPIKRERRRDVIYNGTDAREFAIAVSMWISLLDDMETALARHDWLAGDAYTISDAAYTPYLTRLDHLHVLGFMDGKPRVAGWYERIKARPSYKPGITDWLDDGYLSLMAEKGDEAWPTVEAMIRKAQ